MLTKSEQKRLKALAHSLKPVVLIGSQGLTAAVIEAINEALTAHELIKVKLHGSDKAMRDQLAVEIAGKTGADQVNAMGHIVTFYRPKPDDSE